MGTNVIFNDGQKYCVDCKWYNPADHTDWECLSPKNVSVDLLSGCITKNLFHPGFLREENSGGCGIDGKWFEEKEKGKK